MDQAQALDDLMEKMITEYLEHNRAAAVLKGMLDETGVGDANDTPFICNEIFYIDLRFIRSNFGQARGAIFVADFA